MKIFVNHIGFEQSDKKMAVFEADGKMKFINSYLLRKDGAIFRVEVGEKGKIADWSDSYYYLLNFSDVVVPGQYQVVVETEQEKVCSDYFEITDYYIHLRMVNAVRAYFKGERSSGEWLKADKQVPFDGERKGRRDLHGGWYDATGDLGIHLTQLSHTGIYNPMQSLLPAFVCFSIAERIQQKKLKDGRILKKELQDEGYWGADLAMRLYCENGSFLRSVDRGEAFSEKQNRKIDYEYFHYSGHEEDKIYLKENIQDKNYETGMRSGCGLAITVLAQAARLGAASGEYTETEYLQIAERAFHYIVENNVLHINDGKWNFLDYYWGLIAAIELYETTQKEVYLNFCRNFELKMESYVVEMKEGCWFLADEEHLYFHPSDEGVPLLALLKYSQIEPDKETEKHVLSVVKSAMIHLLSISKSAFGYASFTWKKDAKEKKEENRFFFPHDTKAAPWWQGENARICSLAAIAFYYANISDEKDMVDECLIFGQRQLDWIMGCNPFDSCMIEGYGKNNIRYFFNDQYDFMNSPGGICNGITSRTMDDCGIEFVTETSPECRDNWRWAEQWLPHAAWYMFATGLKLL